MTIPGQSIRSLNFSTSQVLGAGIAAGALALYVWRRGFSGSNASACDTPEAGNESDEIVLYGEGRRLCAYSAQFGMQDGCGMRYTLREDSQSTTLH